MMSVSWTSPSCRVDDGIEHAGPETVAAHGNQPQVGHAAPSRPDRRAGRSSSTASAASTCRRRRRRRRSCSGRGDAVAGARRPAGRPGPRTPPASTTVSGQRCRPGRSRGPGRARGRYAAVWPCGVGQGDGGARPDRRGADAGARSAGSRSRPSCGSKFDFSACCGVDRPVRHGHAVGGAGPGPAAGGRRRLGDHPAGRRRPSRPGCGVGRALPGVDSEPAVDRTGRGVDAAHRHGGRSTRRASSDHSAGVAAWDTWLHWTPPMPMTTSGRGCVARRRGAAEPPRAATASGPAARSARRPQRREHAETVATTSASGQATGGRWPGRMSGCARRRLDRRTAGIWSLAVLIVVAGAAPLAWHYLVIWPLDQWQVDVEVYREAGPLDHLGRPVYTR